MYTDKRIFTTRNTPIAAMQFAIVVISLETLYIN